MMDRSCRYCAHIPPERVERARAAIRATVMEFGSDTDGNARYYSRASPPLHASTSPSPSPTSTRAAASSVELPFNSLSASSDNISSNHDNSNNSTVVSPRRRLGLRGPRNIIKGSLIGRKKEVKSPRGEEEQQNHVSNTPNDTTASTFSSTRAPSPPTEDVERRPPVVSSLSLSLDESRNKPEPPPTKFEVVRMGETDVPERPDDNSSRIYETRGKRGSLSIHLTRGDEEVHLKMKRRSTKEESVPVDSKRSLQRMKEMGTFTERKSSHTLSSSSRVPAREGFLKAQPRQRSHTLASSVTTAAMGESIPPAAASSSAGRRGSAVIGEKPVRRSREIRIGVGGDSGEDHGEHASSSQVSPPSPSSLSSSSPPSSSQQSDASQKRWSNSAPASMGGPSLSLVVQRLSTKSCASRRLNGRSHRPHPAYSRTHTSQREGREREYVEQVIDHKLHPAIGSVVLQGLRDAEEEIQHLRSRLSETQTQLEIAERNIALLLSDDPEKEKLSGGLANNNSIDHLSNSNNNNHNSGNSSGINSPSQSRNHPVLMSYGDSELDYGTPPTHQRRPLANLQWP